MALNPLNKSYCSILWSSISLEGSFFGSREGKIWTAAFGWVGLAMSLTQSECRIFWSSLSLERINWYLSFVVLSKPSKERSIWDHYFWLIVASYASCPFRLQDSLIISISGKDSIDVLVFFLHRNIHQRKLASRTGFWAGVARWASLPIKFHDSLIVNIFGRNQVIP